MSTNETKDEKAAKGETTRNKYSRREVFMVPPEDLTIVLDPTHRLYDERATLPLDPAMVANIDALGVKENLILEREDGKLLIKDGRQRCRWALEVNKTRSAAGAETLKVPCTFEKDEDSMATMIALNEVRQQDDVILKAKKAARYIAQLLATEGAAHSQKSAEQRAAVVFGTKPGTVRNWLKLLDLAPEIQAQVSNGTISYVGALTTAELPKAEQAKVAEKIAAEAAANPKAPAQHVKGKGSGPRVQVAIKDVAAKVVEQAAASGVKVSVTGVHDKVQYGKAPKRGGLRKAMVKASEGKGKTNRIAEAILGWVLGDDDARKSGLAELSDDEKGLLRSIFAAGKPQKAE